MNILKGKSTHFFLISLLLFSSGCARHAPAPISSRPAPPKDLIDYHVVSSGETLYSIAWRYELDYQQLAKANGIAAPYTIYSGQRLNLDLTKSVNTNTPKNSSRQAVVATKPGVAESKSKPTSSAKPSASKPSAPKPSTAGTSSSTGNTSSKTIKTIKPAGSSPESNAKKVASLPKSWSWQWPAKGRVSRHYDSSKVFKGIYISSGKGSKVEAAGPGVVVYAGSGLRGYGQLVIVKHSDTFLSAYANNHQILVAEGEMVTAGQKIAEVGGDMEDSKRLYFEIRKNGKPIDPVRLLPRQ
ncbi:peptidoglycan DD-metalloendopeptidase family protein [Porticoccaceae bacterium LTM1]|nr:peptidoglycan DD-metalloendopeptidase family protein [Porticoccaceae bacterium LTM1]